MIRIPGHIAEMFSIKEGTEIEIWVEEQGIRLIPKKRKPTLEELLDKVTDMMKLILEQRGMDRSNAGTTL